MSANQTDFSYLAPVAAPVLAGFLINATLYGALAVQCFWYYMSFPKDRVITKSLVAILFLLETAQTGLMWNDALHCFALDFGNPDAMDNLQMGWFDVPILSGIIALIVQHFFTYRVYTLSKSIICVILISSTSLAQCVAACYTGVRMFQLGTNSRATSDEDLKVGISVWLAISAACDGIIAITMVYCLSRLQAPFRKTEILVSKLMRMSVETGAITAVVAVATVFLFFHSAGGAYYAALTNTLAKLYSNVIVTVLNRRIKIIGGRDAEDSTFLNVSTELRFQGSPRSHNVYVVDTGSRQNGVVVYKEQESWADREIPLNQYNSAKVNQTVQQSDPELG